MFKTVLVKNVKVRVCYCSMRFLQVFELVGGLTFTLNENAIPSGERFLELSGE